MKTMRNTRPIRILTATIISCYVKESLRSWEASRT